MAGPAVAGASGITTGDHVAAVITAGAHTVPPGQVTVRARSAVDTVHVFKLGPVGAGGVHPLGVLGTSTITADNRTATTVTTSGQTYTVRTTTTSGANAFNSFTTFTVAQDDTVDLYLPTGTTNLINLVWDSQAQINGTLNSYIGTSTTIGGNVFFADPHGVVVGSAGVINVGALSLSTPSWGFMCSLLAGGGNTCATTGVLIPAVPGEPQDTAGMIDIAAAGFTNILQGSAPISNKDEAKVDVQGAINAANAVRIRARAIDVSGTIYVKGDGAGGFQTSVNLGSGSAPTLVQDNNTIRIVANASDHQASGDATADASVNVTGALYAGTTDAKKDTDVSQGQAGGAIIVKAISDAASEYGNAAGDVPQNTLATDKAENLIHSKTSVFSNKKLGTLGYVRAKSTASVAVGGGAVFAATGDIQLSSNVTTTATTLATAAVKKKKKGRKARAGNRSSPAVVIAAMYGSATGTATTNVAAGSTPADATVVHAGGKLQVGAYTNNTLGVSATSIATDKQKAVGTLAWSNAEINANSGIANGVDVGATSVEVVARNVNDFQTTATASVAPAKKKTGGSTGGTGGTGDTGGSNPVQVGAAAAVSVQNVHAVASEGADLTNVASLSVEADSINNHNATIAGTAFSQRKAKGTAKTAEQPTANLSENSLATGKGASKVKIGAAIAWTDTTLGASAEVADNATISATGNVTVHANVLDDDIRNHATSSATSKRKAPDGTSEITVVAGIAVGLYAHDAEALVGKDANITAAHVGVGSRVLLPFTWGENNADTLGVLGTMWDDVSSFVSGVNTLASDINTDYVGGLSSYAGASAKTKTDDSTTISGSVNWFQVTNTSKAWVDEGASLTATQAVGAGGWTSTAYDGSTLTWNDAITIAANTALTSVNAVGDVDIFALAKTLLKGKESNTAVGGAFNTVRFASTTTAGVASDAVLVATQGGVDVAAHTIDHIIAISPVAGKGGDNAIQGTLALGHIDDKTYASISRDAKVTADNVAVSAQADLMVWSISGALAMSDKASVGLAVGVNDITTDTRAWIGDNTGDVPHDTVGVASGSGFVHAGDLSVVARTQGQSGAITVSGSSTGGKGGGKGKAGGSAGDKTNTTTAAQDSALNGEADDSSKASTVQNKAAGDSSGASKDTKAKGSKFGLNISGAASVDMATLGTRAYLRGAHVDGNGGSNATLVQAINDAELTSVAGSAAISRAKAPSDGEKFSATIAGAVAYSDIGNVTAGYIEGSSLANADHVTVRALNAAEQIDIAIGIGVSTSDGKEPSGTLAGSVSIAHVADDTQARLVDSSVHGSATAGSRSLDVTAYDRSRIGVGGGSLSVSMGKNKSSASAALALTYAKIDNTTKAAIEGASAAASWDVDGYDALDVHAWDSSLIGAGALAVSVSGKGSGLAGSFIWNDIDNTTRAVIDAGARVRVGGDVSLVAASTTPMDTLDAIIDVDGITDHSGYDFGGKVMDDNANANKTAHGSPTDKTAPDIDLLIDDGYGSSIIAVAGAVQVGKNSVGLSFVGSQVNNTHEAVLSNATLDAGTHTVTLGAHDNTRIISLAVGGGVAKGNFAGTGSLTYNGIGNTDRVQIGDTAATDVTTHLTAGKIDGKAGDKSHIYSLSGNIAVSKSVAIGGALTWNDIGNTVEVHASHAALDAGSGNVGMTATNEALIMSGAIAGAVSTKSSGAAVGLSFGWNKGHSSTTALVDGNSTVKAGGDLSLASDNATHIYTLSGAVAIGGSAAVGAAANVSDIDDSSTAKLDTVGLDVGNDVNVTASGTGEAYALAVGVAVSKQAGIAASNTNNIINNTIDAEAVNLQGIDIDGTLSGAAAADTLTISAGNDAGAYALAGSVGGASKVGVGAAFAINVIGGETKALLQDSALAVTNAVNITSTSDAVIQTAAIAGAGGGTAGVAGSATTNFITSTVEAGIGNSGIDAAGNDTSVHATDASRIDSLAGGIGFGGTAGVGVAVAVNRIEDHVNAWMEGGTDNRTWHARNLVVQADSTVSHASGLIGDPDIGGNINTVAIGGAGGGTAAVAGSLAVNLMSGSVGARIGNADDDSLAAHVVAEDNVGVLAGSEQGINVFAGAAAIGGDAGVGVGVVVNKIDGTTLATIQGNSQVTALARDPTDSLVVSTGTLADPDALNFSVLGDHARDIDDLSDPGKYVAPDLSMTTTKVTGVAVNASNRQHVATLGVAVSGSGTAAVSAMAGVNLIGGTTLAIIDHARINQEHQDLAASDQRVDVRAGNQQMEANFTLGAAGGTVGVAGSVASNVFNADTEARIDGATTYAVGDTVVAAHAGQGSMAASVGGAAGAVGVAASAAVTLFDTTTLARVQGGTLVVHGLDVTAINRGWNTQIVGALAAGVGAGAGAFIVNVAQTHTTAAVDQVHTLDLSSGDLGIDAETHNASQSVGASGSLGAGSGAVAGVAVVNVIANTTTAKLTDTTVHGAHNVTVHATEAQAVDVVSGALAVDFAGVGVGAGINIAVLQSTVTATIGGSTVHADGAVNVLADATRDIDAISVAGGGGLWAGGGVAASFIMAGAGDASVDNDGSKHDSMDDLNKDGNVDRIKSFTNKGHVDSDLAGSRDHQLSTSDIDDINASSNYDLGATLNKDHDSYGKTDGISALVASSTVDSDALKVTADSQTATSNTVGGVGVGGFAGVGGALAFTGLNSAVSAGIDSGSNVTVDHAINVNARATNHGGKDAVAAKAYEGAGGLVGIGAAIAIGRADATVTASAAGTLRAGNTNVTSSNGESLDVEAQGYTVGVVAAGAVIARADKHGTTQTILGSTDGSNTTIFGHDPATNKGHAYGITATSGSVGAVHAFTRAGAGGVYAGSGSDAAASDTSTTTTTVGDNVSLAADDMTLDATATPQVSARAEGYGFSVIANVGVALAAATATANVGVATGENDRFLGGNLTLAAAVTAGGGNTTDAWSEAAGGGLLVGVNATSSTTTLGGNVNADLGSAYLRLTGDATVSAGRDTHQHSVTQGYTGGLVAAGGSNATASSSGSVQASAPGIFGSANGTLTVSTSGTDHDYAETTSGSGGVIAGSVANADASDTTHAKAQLGTDAHDALDAGKINISAEHGSQANSRVSSVQAAVAGMSGANAQNTVATIVSAGVLDNANITTRGFVMSAHTIVTKPELANDGVNVQAAAGGLFSGPAAKSVTNVSVDSTATLGKDSRVTVGGDKDNPGATEVSAHNDIDLHDRAKLDSGGAIAVARADSDLRVNHADATVQMAEGAALDTVGAATLSAWNNATLTAKSNVKTYGLAGAAQGYTVADVNFANVINIATGADIRADGDVNLNAGRDNKGTEGRISAVARTDIFNKTAFPVSLIGADASITQTDNIVTAVGSKVRSVADVNLTTTPGQTYADGKAVGKDLYRELASKVASAFSHAVGGGDVSLDIEKGSSTTTSATGVQVDGQVLAGIQNKQFLTIDKDGNVTEKSDGVTCATTDCAPQLFDYAGDILKQIDKYRKLAIAYAEDVHAKTAFEAELRRLKLKLVRLGLGKIYRAVPDGNGGYTLVEDPNGDIIDAADGVKVNLVEVKPILARGGDINVAGDYLSGTGTLSAPGDAQIKIENASTSFLRIDGLDIPYKVGGHLRLNGAYVGTNGAIAAFNPSGSPVAAFQSIVTGLNSPAPDINVSSTYLDQATAWGPDIQVRGDVLNLGGDVNFFNAGGSILQLAKDNSNDASRIDGKNVYIKADNGSVVQAYYDGFKHTAGDPRTNPDPQGHEIAGDRVFINARYVNINGLIESGIPNWTLTLGATVKAGIDADAVQYAAMTPSQRAAHGPLYQLTGFEGDPTGTITANYNASTGRIELSAVQVKGGYVDITGEIMSTGNGRIESMDGYGSITVDNQTGHAIVINHLGVGHDIEGVIRLTDVRHDGTVIGTRYTRVGNDVQVEHLQGKDKQGKDVWVNVATRSNTRAGGNYQPAQGENYIWKTGTDSTQLWKYTAESDSTFWFVPSGSANYSSHTLVSQGVETPLVDGQYTRIGPPLAPPSVTYNTTGLTFDHRHTHHHCGFLCFEKTYYVDDYYTQGQKTIKTYSLQADHPVTINFIGNDTGAVSIASDASVYFNAGVDSGNGPLSVKSTGGGIFANSSNAQLAGPEVKLIASDGIGGADGRSALAIDATDYVSADATNGNVNLSAHGDMPISRVEAHGGDVSLAAGASLLARSGGSLGNGTVGGNDITLTTAAGTIGTEAMPLNLQQGGGVAGLSAQAQGDIWLRQSNGDLRVNHVESLGGDVWLDVPHGSLVDANTNEVRDTRTEDELLHLWNNMRLLGAGAEQSADDTIAAYKQQQESAYQNYWRTYRHVQAVYDTSGKITGYASQPFDADFHYVAGAQELDVLRNQLHWTDAQITDYEGRRTQQVVALNTAYGSSTYDPAWTFTITDAKRATLSEGSAWTENELKYALGGGILFKQTTDTETRIEEPNVVGRNVTLLAGGSIGTDNGQIVIDGSKNSLTDEQRVALAAAEADDISVDDDTLLITVLKREDFDVKDAVSVTANAHDHLYLGSEHDIDIDSLHSDGSIRVKAAGGLYNVSASGAVAISGGGHFPVILESANSSVGTAQRPMTTDLADDAALTARGNGVFIDELSGDLKLEEIFSRGDISLAADGSLLDDRGARTVAVQGDNVTLRADHGSIGTPGDPLALTSNPGGSLAAVAATGIYIDSPQQSVVATQLASHAGSITLDVDGALQLVSGGRIEAPAVNIAAASLDMGHATLIQADDTIQIATNGDMVLGQLLLGANGTSVSLTAGGDVRRNADNVFNVTSSNPDALVTVRSHAGDIGTPDDPLQLYGGMVGAQADLGNVYLDLPDTNGNNVRDVVANQGSVTVNAVGALDFASVTAGGGDVIVDASGALSGDLVDASGDATLSSAGAMHVADATIGTDLAATSGGAMTLDKANVGRDATLDAAGNLTIGQLDVGHDLTATTNASLEGGTVTVGGNAGLTSAGAMHVATLAVTGALSAQSGDSLTLDKATIGGNGQVDSATSTTLGTLDDKGALAVNAGTTLDVTKLTVTGDTTLASGKSMHVKSAAIGGALDADSKDTMTLESVGVGTSATLDAAGDATLGTLTTGDWLKASIGGALTATSLGVGSAATLTSGGDLHVANATIGTDLAATSGGAMTLDKGKAGRDATLDAAGDAMLGTLTTGDWLKASIGGALTATSLGVGSAATLTSGGDLHVANATIGTDLAATSGGAMTLDKANVGHDATLDAAGNLTIGQLDVGHDLTATTNASLEGGTVTVGGNAGLTSTGAMHVATLAVTGALNAQSGDSLTLDKATIGGNGQIDSATSTTLGTLDAKGALAVNAGTTLDVTKLTVTGDTTLASGKSMHVKSAAIGGALDADSKDTMTLESVGVGTTATLNAAGDATFGTLTTGDWLKASIGGALDATTLGVGSAAMLSSGTGMHVADATIGTDLAATSGGAMTLDKANAGRDATLDAAGNLTIGQLDVGHDLTATTKAALEGGTVTVDGNAGLTSTGAMHVATLAVTGALNAQSGDSLALDQATLGGDGRLTSATATTLGTLDDKGALAVNAGTTLDAAKLSVTGDTTLASGKSMHVTSAEIGGALRSHSGTDMTLDSADIAGTSELGAGGGINLGTVHGAGDMTLTSDGNLQFGTLRGDGNIAGTSTGGSITGTSAQGQGNVKFVAPGDIRYDNLVAGNNLNLDAGTSIAGTSAQALTGSVNADAGTNMDLHSATAGRDVALHAGGNLTLDTADSGDAMDLHAGHDLTAGSVTSGGDLHAGAGHDLKVQKFNATGDVALASSANMSIGKGTSGGTQSLTVGHSLDFGQLHSASALIVDVTGGELHGSGIDAPTVDLAARDAITLDAASVGERFNLASADIKVNVTQTRNDTPLSMAVTGYKDGVAKHVQLSVDTSDPWMLERLAAVQAALDTTTPKVVIEDGHIEQTMHLTTPVADIWMNNQGAELVPSDVQLQQLSYDFNLDQDGKHSFTNAFVVRYGTGYEVQVPNYLESHQWKLTDYLGESALRYTGRLMSVHDSDERKVQPASAAAPASPMRQPSPVRTSSQGGVSVGGAK